MGFAAPSEVGPPDLPEPGGPAVIRLAPGELWCVACGESCGASATQCPACDSTRLVDPLKLPKRPVREGEYRQMYA